MTRGTFALLSLLMIPVGMLLTGFTISVLWGWFIVPTFELPALSMTQALGLGITVGYFTSHLANHDWGEEDLDEKTFRVVVLPFAKTGIFLLFGWIVTLFM